MSDRKYRHRGYQDDDRDRDRDRDRAQDPRPRPTDDRGKPRTEGAPRGRGLGAPTAVAFKCAVCGHPTDNVSVEFDTACPGCAKPLRTCTNCTFFDTSARFECRKPITQRMESKVKANRCEYYQPKAIRDLKSARPEKTQDARSAFDALFKK